VSHLLFQRRHERNPVGLLVVIGLHVLLAVAMLTARLRIDPLPASQSALASIDPPPPPLLQQSAQSLPSAPAAAVRPIVVPVPEVIVDRPDPILATTQETPPPVVSSPTATAVASAAPAAMVSQNDGQTASTGKGDGDGAGGALVEPRLALVDPYAAQCRPDYPAAARMHHVAGTTRLRFSIDATGHIVAVKLLRRSGDMAENRLLDQAAMDWLVHCPAQAGVDKSGHPVGGSADLDYHWRLY
jgi:protein TonB